MGDGPDETALRWVTSVVGQPVVSWRGLRDGGTPWLLTFRDGDSAVLRSSADSDVEIAALGVAADRQVPAPRLLAVGDGVLLISAVVGSSKIPVTRSAERLRAVGAALARLHAVTLAPSADLPLRRRSLEFVDFAKLRVKLGVSDLMRSAEELIARLPEPACTPVFVHGDFWQGNTMWQDSGELAAIIDWDCAGAGNPGVDIGSMRCDAALLYGGDAPDIALAGWEEQARRPADGVAYWDVVAALTTAPDMGLWETIIQDQGRPDLDGATLNARRDEFLRGALDRLN
jgi:aminoglycoside phosphotransferase (APT) family kinase protein